MRADPDIFDELNRAAAKTPRFVVRIEFPSSDLYLSSHDDITGVPATHLAGVLIEPSVSSQKLNPDEGRAEIGAASFHVADVDGTVTDQIRLRLAAGEGLRDRTCRFYLGYEGMAFGDFVLVGTQIVKTTSFDRGAYRVACNDIQRSARKDIFALAETTIASTVESTDATINVTSTAGFALLAHGASYSDAPSSTVGYVKIKDEVIRYTGTTATSFTGCTRGALGTAAGRYVADAATAAARREKVQEYVYLELPGPKLAYAVLTGDLYGDSATLPDSWHLGISTDLVREADFTGIGADLWDPTDDERGLVLRFEGLARADGKQFIETELLRLMGLYMPVYASGELGLRRMTRVLSDAAGVILLDESNSVMVGDLEHDMESLHNSFSIQWNWNGKEFTRTTTYIDADSATKHGRAPVMELRFRGLYGGRHTDAAVLQTLDAIRDRYGAPPQRLRVDVLHSMNRIEVGDVVRVAHRALRDFASFSDTIDRAFEVQSVTVNHRTGAVSLDLFGSSELASTRPPGGPVNALPDAFYTAEGTNLAMVMTITGGVVSGGPYTLAGGADLTDAGSIWYYDDDLTIPAGVTVNLTGNVQLRVMGYFTVNGTINGVGGGHDGVADNTSPTTIISGTPGWVGNSRGYDGMRVHYHPMLGSMESNQTYYRTQPAPLTQAAHAAFPFVQLTVNGDDLLGLPSDLRGTGGGPGGKLRVSTKSAAYTLAVGGGTGGDGGAGLCTISRGMGVGAGGAINLSGADTAAPALYTGTGGWQGQPGVPGAGGPGSYLLLIDGALLSVPDLSGRFVARCGVPARPTAHETELDGSEGWLFGRLMVGGEGPWAGYLDDPAVISGQDLSYSCQRIQYIPAPEDPDPDSDTLPPVETVSIYSGSSGFTLLIEPAPGTPVGAVFEVWQHTSSTPFASATRMMEGATTSFFVPRSDTATVYVWVRARYRTPQGTTIYSAPTPAMSGQPAAAGGTAGTYAIATPSGVSGVAASSAITTGSVTAALVGATATTYAWARQSGSSSITANSASASATTFSATGVAAGASIEAVFRCTINSTYTVDVTVTCANTTSSLAVSSSPTSASASGTAASLTTGSVTATATGGAGGYSYAWTKVSGGSITINSPSSAATTFSATGMAAGETRSATVRVTVTDGAAATATADITVTVTRTSFTVSVAPAVIERYAESTPITTQTATATATGGTAPYSYAWTKVSGDTFTINSPSSAATTFSAAVPPRSSKEGVYRVTATDSASPTPNTATADVSVYAENGYEP